MATPAQPAKVFFSLGGGGGGGGGGVRRLGFPGLLGVCLFFSFFGWGGSEWWDSGDLGGLKSRLVGGAGGRML